MQPETLSIPTRGSGAADGAGWSSAQGYGAGGGGWLRMWSLEPPSDFHLEAPGQGWGLCKIRGGVGG